MLSYWRQLSRCFLHSAVRSGPVSKSPIVPTATNQRSLSTLISSSLQQPASANGFPTAHRLSSTPKPFLTCSESVNISSVRNYMRKYYKPSAWKRYNKHNIEKRLTTDGGLEILWRRVLKGRQNLAVFQRILPHKTHDSKILEKHQLRFRKHPLTKRRLPKPGMY